MTFLASRYGHRSLACLLLAVAATTASTVLAAEAKTGCSLMRPQDSLWLVSSRNACACSTQQACKLQYWRYDTAKSWVTSNLNELTASDDPAVVTTVFIHGNRIGWGEAFTKAWHVYRELVRCADDRPVRFIAWSWPSDAIRGPVNDARVKAGMTDPAAYCLAYLLDQLDPDVKVSLWGHSYGARIATGALHVLGGGALSGSRLATRVHPTRQPANLVLIAAALDNDWLIPGHYHGQALSQSSQVLLVNNGCDALLKRYRLIYHRKSCAEALGYTGLARNWLPASESAKIAQLDASNTVGKGHLLDLYLSSPGLVARMRSTLLGPLPIVKQTAQESVTEPAEAALAANDES